MFHDNISIKIKNKNYVKEYKQLKCYHKTRIKYEVNLTKFS